ncbi:MAG: membrane dipeptidase, partial [Chitinophagaceae bacterium]
MKFLPVFIALITVHAAGAQSFLKVHKRAVLIDSHNDILSEATTKGMVMDEDLSGKTHSDLARWKKGGLDVQFFSVFSDGTQPEPFKYAMRQIDTLHAVALRNPDKIVEVADSRALRKVVRRGKIAAMFGVEGGHQIEDNLSNIDSLFNEGVRYMTLTWNNSTSWATSAFDETFRKDLSRKGLTDFGKQVVQRMNKLGMIVDLSHVGEQTVADVLAITSRPVMASHSSVYNLCPHQRNLKDDQIRAIAKNGGVIQVNFYSGFLDSNFMKRKAAFMERHKTETDSLMANGMKDNLVESYLFGRYREEADSMRAPFELLISHIDYLVKMVGADHVGIGSDFDGIESPPLLLDDVTCYPLVTKALIEKGYSRKEIRKILGGNMLR